MSIGLSIGADESYKCNTCNLTNIEIREDFDCRSWTCHTCGEPICITIGNSDGGQLHLERLPAHAVDIGYFLAFEGRLFGRQYKVLASRPVSKDKQYLEIQSFRGIVVDNKKIFHRIIG